MALDTFNSIPHLQEQRSLPVKGVTVSVNVPTLAAAEAAESVSATVTGAKIGDIVTAAPQAALPTNASFIGAFVAATDTVHFSFTNLASGAVTGAARNFTVWVEHRS